MKSQYLLICVFALSMLTVSVMSSEYLFGGDVDNFSEFLQEEAQVNKRRNRYQNTYKFGEEGEEEEGEGDEEGAAEEDAPAGGLIHEGWLKISSVEFLDFTRNPAVPMPDGSLHGVEVADPESGKQSYFRTNSQFGGDPEISDKTSFYFRLSGKNLYYTETKTDMRVLGAISVKNIKSVGGSQLGEFCFIATNEENDTWDLCADDSTTRGQWIDSISKALGVKAPVLDAKPAEPKVIKEEVLIKQPIIMMAQPSPFCNDGWNYVSHGSDWNCKCSEGAQQSPIPIQMYGELLNKSAMFSFNSVNVGALSLVNEDSIIKLRSSVEDDDFSFGTIIDIDYVEYSCKEVHLHAPAEHTVNGKEYPVEVQVMCDPTTEGDMRKKAVISFMVQNIPGGSNRFFDRFDFMDLPNQVAWNRQLPAPEDEGNISIEDFWRVEKEDTFHGYFTYVNYMGSTTSPPCQEETKWFIVEEPLNLGIAAIEMIKDAIITVPSMASGSKVSVLASDLAPRAPEGNNRVMQDGTGRQFLKFDLMQNDCYPKPEKAKKVYGDGHYEKVQKDMLTYIYIPNTKPTGLPGAFVVTKEEALGKELETADSNK